MSKKRIIIGILLSTFLIILLSLFFYYIFERVFPVYMYKQAISDLRQAVTLMEGLDKQKGDNLSENLRLTFNKALPTLNLFKNAENKIYEWNWPYVSGLGVTPYVIKSRTNDMISAICCTDQYLKEYSKTGGNFDPSRGCWNGDTHREVQVDLLIELTLCYNNLKNIKNSYEHLSMYFGDYNDSGKSLKRMKMRNDLLSN